MNDIHLSRYDQSWYARGRNLATVALWDMVQTLLVHPSPHGCNGWRRFLYRCFGARIGKRVRIGKSVRCNYPWKLSIGDHSWIGDEVTLYCLERIDIADNAVISQQAYLCTGSHDHTDPHFGLKVAPIRIEHGAWVALGALVMPGITVHRGALIAARAVLTRDAESWTIYSGIPATSQGQRILKPPPATENNDGATH